MRYRDFAFFAAFLLLAATAAEARRRDVDNSERLRYLNQATGEAGPVTSSSDSFQTRLDAIMNVDATSENTVVSTADEALRQARVTAALQSSLTTNPLAEKRKDNNQGRLTTRVDQFRSNKQGDLPGNENPGSQKIRVDLLQDPNRVDASEEAYRQSLEDLQTEQDEARKRVFEKRTLAASDDTPAKTSPGVSRALANNPFYFQTAGTEARKFDDDKPILMSRLVEKGYDYADAERLINQSSSPEELIMKLMEDEEATYGEASDIVNT